MMEYNVCRNCGAKDGRAGLLFTIPSLNIENFCVPCKETLEQQALVLHTRFSRTEEEISKIVKLIK